MAVTKIKPVKSTLSKALDYIQNPDKTDGKMLVSSFGCSYETADIEFAFTLSQALDKLPSLLLKKLRHFPIADTVYIMSGVPAVPMKHHNIGNGKAMSLEVGGVVYIKACVNIFKGNVRRKGRGIDQLIICPVYCVSRRLQTVVRLKAQVPCFVPAL